MFEYYLNLIFSSKVNPNYTSAFIYLNRIGFKPEYYLASGLSIDFYHSALFCI
ncbi:hypothetical protein PITCH_A510010 [uncultured Desulfobacterium sp.]|uniref:Uncharacterized protein n=1 Tax=uncultured Desulfobacterium sp. TaxID=201089 RepID=A0A445N0L4_9BACT|nr:hypothetical protein PITCH_A510010 [uncultured Desulfobacterium sp.]